MMTWMRSVAAMALLVAGLGGAASAAPVAVGDAAPGFGGKWLNHESTTLADLRGRAVLAVFWRTW